MRPSMMALVSTRMLPLRDIFTFPLALSSPGNMADMSRFRCAPSHIPNTPRNRLTITGTPQLNHPFKEYRGIEISEAMTSPTSKPTVPAIRVALGMELI